MGLFITGKLFTYVEDMENGNSRFRTHSKKAYYKIGATYLTDLHGFEEARKDGSCAAVCAPRYHYKVLSNC